MSKEPPPPQFRYEIARNDDPINGVGEGSSAVGLDVGETNREPQPSLPGPERWTARRHTGPQLTSMLKAPNEIHQALRDGTIVRGNIVNELPGQLRGCSVED